MSLLVYVIQPQKKEKRKKKDQPTGKVLMTHNQTQVARTGPNFQTGYMFFLSDKSVRMKCSLYTRLHSSAKTSEERGDLLHWEQFGSTGRKQEANEKVPYSCQALISTMLSGRQEPTRMKREKNECTDVCQAARSL